MLRGVALLGVDIAAARFGRDSASCRAFALRRIPVFGRCDSEMRPEGRHSLAELLQAVYGQVEYIHNESCVEGIMSASVVKFGDGRISFALKIREIRVNWSIKRSAVSDQRLAN